MKNGKIMGSIYWFCEWMMTLAWINILWLIGTIIGLGFFGWAPSTASVIHVLHEIMEKKTVHVSIKKLFIKEYKDSFMKANILGYVLFICLFALIFGFLSLPYLSSPLIYILFIFYGLMASSFVIMALFVFSILVRYYLPLKETIKAALLIGMANLYSVLAIVACSVIIFVLFMAIPGSMIFYFSSLPALVITGFVHKALERTNQSMNHQTPLSK